MRPNNRSYGDQGDLTEVNVAIESRLKPEDAANLGFKESKAHDKSMPEGTGGESNVVKEPTCLKLTYDLKTGSTQNYDSNAMEHRIRQHVLKSQLVDTCGSAVDSTFASIEVAC